MGGQGNSQWSLATRWLVLAATLIGLAFFTGRLAEIPWRSALRGWDNSFYYFWLRSAVEDGDWDFANEIELNNTIAPEDREAARDLPRTGTGRVPNKYGIGWAVASLPFYLLAKGFVCLANAMGGGWANDGFSAPFQIAQQVGHLLYACLGLFLLYRCLREWIGPDAAARGMAVGWLATPLLYYQSTNLSMSHNLVFTIVAGALYVALRIRRTPGDPRWWMVLGALAGLCAITRYQAVLGLIPPVWLALAAAYRTDPHRLLSRQAGRCILAAAAALPFIGLQMFAWHRVYGTPLIFTYGAAGEGFHWTDPALLEVLFSPFHGAFYWHPILLAGWAVWGWARLPEALSELRWPVWVAGLGTWYVYAAWWVWSLGASFGYRGFDVLWPYALAGLALLWARLSAAPARARWGMFLASVLMIWNVQLCLTYAIGLIERNAPVTYADMFLALMDLPSVIGEWLANLTQ